MNRIDITRNGGEARLRYLDGDFQVVTPGSFVRCAVTGAAQALASRNSRLDMTLRMMAPLGWLAANPAGP